MVHGGVDGGGAQAIVLHRSDVLGFVPLQRLSETTSPSFLRQFTLRILSPPPHVRLQFPHEPLDHE